MAFGVQVENPNQKKAGSMKKKRKVSNLTAKKGDRYKVLETGIEYEFTGSIWKVAKLSRPCEIGKEKSKDEKKQDTEKP